MKLLLNSRAFITKKVAITKKKDKMALWQITFAKRQSINGSLRSLSHEEELMDPDRVQH